MTSSSKQPEAKAAPAPRWHVIAVSGRKEIFAKHHLKANGHEVYLPMRLVRTADTLVPRPMFPGYLFVRVKAASEWWSILTTMGVRSVIGTAHRPQAVKAGVVEALQAAEVDGLIHLMNEEELASRFQHGDPVTVMIGKKGAQVRAIFLEQVDSERCRLLVSLCGADSRPVLPMSQVSS